MKDNKNVTQNDLKVLKLQENSCHFMTNLVEDIIDLSRIEFNKFELNEAWFSMKDLIEEVFDIVSFQVTSKGLLLDY
jgi:signal transduction histidine kinase